jgi:hypothetical protein
MADVRSGHVSVYTESDTGGVEGVYRTRDDYWIYTRVYTRGVGESVGNMNYISTLIYHVFSSSS